MKTLSIFLALINALLAGLLLMYTLSSNEIHEANTLWLLTKSLIALSIIVIGLLTWLACMMVMSVNPLLIGGLNLVVLGAVTIVWTYHLAITRGNLDYYMALYGASLMMQGIATLLGFGVQSQSISIT